MPFDVKFSEIRRDNIYGTSTEKLQGVVSIGPILQLFFKLFCLQDKKSVRKENEANNKDKDECDGFGGGSNGNANGDDDDEEWSTDVTAEAIKERMKDLSSGW